MALGCGDCPPAAGRRRRSAATAAAPAARRRRPAALGQLEVPLGPLRGRLQAAAPGAAGRSRRPAAPRRGSCRPARRAATRARDCRAPGSAARDRATSRPPPARRARRRVARLQCRRAGVVEGRVASPSRAWRPPGISAAAFAGSPARERALPFGRALRLRRCRRAAGPRARRARGLGGASVYARSRSAAASTGIHARGTRSAVRVSRDGLRFMRGDQVAHRAGLVRHLVRDQGALRPPPRWRGARRRGAASGSRCRRRPACTR